jgi:hypothetical protein
MRPIASGPFLSAALAIGLYAPAHFLPAARRGKCPERVESVSSTGVTEMAAYGAPLPFATGLVKVGNPPTPAVARFGAALRFLAHKPMGSGLSPRSYPTWSRAGCPSYGP